MKDAKERANLRFITWQKLKTDAALKLTEFFHAKNNTCRESEI